MFEFHTNATIARETEKAWGIRTVNQNMVWLPKSQCEVIVDARPNEADIIRAEVTALVIEHGWDLAEKVDFIENVVKSKMDMLPLIVRIPDWLVRKNDLYSEFYK